MVKMAGLYRKEKVGKGSKASGLERSKLGHGMETRQRSNMYGVRHFDLLIGPTVSYASWLPWDLKTTPSENS